MKITHIGLGIVILILVGAFIVYNYNAPHGTYTAPTGSQANLVPIQLTDPPQVPAGTTSLIIDYSSLQVRTSGSANTSSVWTSSNTSGSVDLLSLLNYSETIGTVSLPANAVIRAVKFNITSASITINGTTYGVTVPGNTVIQSQLNLPSNTLGTNQSSLLLSLSPTVVSILTPNSTIFVLVPSLNAVVVPRGASNSITVRGYREKLNSRTNESIDSSRPNLTIVSASLVTSAGNSTEITVTVKDDSNRSVVLKHMSISGKLSTQLNNSMVYMNTERVQSDLLERLAAVPNCTNLSIENTNISSDISSRANLPMIPAQIGARLDGNGEAFNNSTAGKIYNGFSKTVSNDLGDNGKNFTPGAIVNGIGANISNTLSGKGINPIFQTRGEFEDINTSLLHSFGLGVNNSVCTPNGILAFRNRLNVSITNIASKMKTEQERYGLITLFIGSNGSVYVPSTINDSENYTHIGYTIPANGTATFTFNGTLRLGESGISMHLLSGSDYRITLFGEDGAYAATNVTAG